MEAVTNLEYKSDNKITDQPNCIESEIDDDLHYRIELKSANCKICFPRKTQERQKVKCYLCVKHIEVVDLATKFFCKTIHQSSEDKDKQEIRCEADEGVFDALVVDTRVQSQRHYQYGDNKDERMLNNVVQCPETHCTGLKRGGCDGEYCACYVDYITELHHFAKIEHHCNKQEV